MRRHMVIAGAAFAAAPLVFVQATALAQENGYGPDPDGDGNPATITQTEFLTGNPDDLALFGSPYRIITFEAPPGSHNEEIINQYQKEFGVTFGDGLTRQVCRGEGFKKYESQCTYLRAPSGRYAGLYRDDLNRPLRINFQNPVCVAALSVYPTGGKEGERFELTMQGYAADGRALDPGVIEFTWTENTVKWRNMVAAYYSRERASYMDVSMKTFRLRDPNEELKKTGFREDYWTPNEPGDMAAEREVEALEKVYEPIEEYDRVGVMRFLVDDVAYVADESDCQTLLPKVLPPQAAGAGGASSLEKALGGREEGAQNESRAAQ